MASYELFNVDANEDDDQLIQVSQKELVQKETSKQRNKKKGRRKKKKSCQPAECLELGNQLFDLKRAQLFNDDQIDKEICKHADEMYIPDTYSETLLKNADGYLEKPDEIILKSIDTRVLDYWMECNKVPSKAKLLKTNFLILAAGAGHIKAVQKLLTLPINVNQTSTKSLSLHCTALHSAISTGQIEIIQMLLAHPDIKVNKGKTITPLVFAIHKTNINIIDLLLQHPRIDINYESTACRSPLHCAFDLKQFAIIDKLLQHNADTEKRDSNGFTLLHIACFEQNEELVDKLLIYNAAVNVRNNFMVTPLITACVKGNYNIAEKLILHNADVHYCYTDMSNPTSYIINTPILSACESSSISIVELLMRHQCDINRVFKSRMTPLIRMVMTQKFAMVQNLIMLGADIHQKTLCNRTAILIASANGFEEIVEELIVCGACNDVTDENQSSLHVAAMQGHVKVVTTLLHYSKASMAPSMSNIMFETNVMDRDIHGNTAIHLAAMYGNHLIIAKLTPHMISTNINPTNDNGETPIIMAAKYNHVKSVVCLLACNADVNHGDKNGETPLHIACRHGNQPLVQLLLTKNACQTKNKQGKLPINVAQQYPQIVSLLKAQK